MYLSQIWAPANWAPRQFGGKLGPALFDEWDMIFCKFKIKTYMDVQLMEHLQIKKETICQEAVAQSTFYILHVVFSLKYWFL